MPSESISDLLYTHPQAAQECTRCRPDASGRDGLTPSRAFVHGNRVNNFSTRSDAHATICSGTHAVSDASHPHRATTTTPLRHFPGPSTRHWTVPVAPLSGEDPMGLAPAPTHLISILNHIYQPNHQEHHQQHHCLASRFAAFAFNVASSARAPAPRFTARSVPASGSVPTPQSWTGAAPPCFPSSPNG